MDTPTAIAAAGIWVAVFFGGLQSYLAYLQLVASQKKPNDLDTQSDWVLKKLLVCTTAVVVLQLSFFKKAV